MSGGIDWAGVKPRDVALVALRGALAEIAEIQQRQALRAGVAALHGARSLPLREFFRQSLPRTGTALSGAGQYVESEARTDDERLMLLYPMVEALEALFRDERAQRDQDFMAAMARHFRGPAS